MFELKTATHLVQFHVQDLIRSVSLAANNVELLTVVADFGHDLAHFVSQLIESSAQAVVGCLLSALGQLLCFLSCNAGQRASHLEGLDRCVLRVETVQCSVNFRRRHL